MSSTSRAGMSFALFSLLFWTWATLAMSALSSQPLAPSPLPIQPFSFSFPPSSFSLSPSSSSSSSPSPSTTPTSSPSLSPIPSSAASSPSLSPSLPSLPSPPKDSSPSPSSFNTTGAQDPPLKPPRTPPPAPSTVQRSHLPAVCNSLLSVDNVASIIFGNRPPAAEECALALYKNLTPVIDSYSQRLATDFSYCIVDPEADRSATFDFSQNLTFVDKCFFETKGDFMDRVCGIGEINLYVKSLVALANSKSSGVLSPPINTINCNKTEWVPGCEDGWASRLSVQTSAISEKVREDINYVPHRTLDPYPCCEGFFCPRGLTCMMPCPLGAYCPKAKLNSIKGTCEPYGYEIPPGRNVTCGGANMWADVGSTSAIFCEAGFYCPGTTVRFSCDSGHYCRQGSMSQSKCSRTTTCNSNAASQNIKAFGLMIILMLTMLLLIMYNCSDHIMYIRDKRHAKVREAAARHVREHLRATERWKLAKEAAKRLSRNFSSRQFKKSGEVQSLTPPHILKSHELQPSPLQPSPLRLASGYNSESPGYGSGIYGRSSLSGPIQPTETSGRPSLDKRSGPVNADRFLDEDLFEAIGVPPPMLRPPEDEENIVDFEEFPHTRSQIFKYAYGQIEREKAFQNKPMNWKGAVQGATHPVNRDRIELEVVFEDLSLILRRSGRRILSNLTGKFSPCRIAAVMGPSGAGKTMFLNALAGKTHNSTITGSILINGKAESIHLYKKIIGFVPQDDIVHGNLTVEENLWFSAHCRLPVKMQKADKVLIVERIIETLGLQNIRNLMVGTVEKRGISGGQRKRVNVGLEMVIEPSFLILDEPTSGLDSTSSQLVMKALRREAFSGVNIVVVLHQPSYGLFRMFDDVMFLAKGGRAVYIGPVDEVEAYFATLGIIAPERINPPDHYMDVLEGIAKPDGNSQFDPRVLPFAWMRHNKYDIPEEISACIVNVNAPLGILKWKKADDSEASKHVRKASSFAEELRDEIKAYFEAAWWNVRSTSSADEDLSHRETPGFRSQFRIILRRVAKQRFREAQLQAQDYLILLLAGACLGVLSGVKDSNLGSGGYPFTIITLSLLCMISALRSFSLDKLQFWRESASGINKVAYFLAKDTIDQFNTAMKPLVYLSIFYFFNSPRSTFAENYIVTLALVYCVVGFAYIFAIVLENSPAQLWCVFFSIVSTLIATRSNPTGVVKAISYITYARWAQEAYVIVNAKRYSGVWLVTRCFVLGAGKYRLDHWALCIFILVAYGILARTIALLCLLFHNRSRQR